MPATWTTTNGTASEGVADAPRGVSAFFSLGQLSRFGTLYLLGEQDRIVGIPAMSCIRLKLAARSPE